MISGERDHPWADTYRKRFKIPDDHLFRLLEYQAKTSRGRDEDWYTFVERLPDGTLLKTYKVYSALRETDRSSFTHTYKIHDLAGILLMEGEFDSI